MQRFTGVNSYTRSYEDLFLDFQREDFRPRFSSPAVGRGVDLTAEVPEDAAGRPRSRAHPDIGPHAAPAEWWADIDSGRATIVDGAVPLDAHGRDCGAGTPAQPFSTLAKALAFARWGARIYIKDGIYRHAAIQTTFALGPDSVISGFPGHRPAFSPSEFIEPGRWEQATPAGLYRIRDWHTFLGYNSRMHPWMADWYGNARIGGAGANVTALERNTANVRAPFRPVRYLPLDRDTPQVLADGVALQPAGGVLGLEEFSIGTMSAWGRDPSHLRPGAFMVGRRDYLVSQTVGKPPLGDGAALADGPNPDPEMNYRINGTNVGYISEFVARPPVLWQAVHTYENGDRLWELDAAVVARMGRLETRALTSGCDVWLNNPLRPQEASGTSGMKPPLHGGLNCSVLDGWWPEAWNGRNGWAIGDGTLRGTRAAQDRADAELIYTLLEREIVPLFYARDGHGVPQGWVRRMKDSMRSVCGVFNTHRMVAEYVRLYAP